MDVITDLKEAENGLPPSVLNEKPTSNESELLQKAQRDLLHLMQQTQEAMSTRVEQIEGIQQQQAEKLTAALEEASELAAVYREQLTQHDSHMQKLEKLIERQERALAVLVKMSQQPPPEG